MSHQLFDQEGALIFPEPGDTAGFVAALGPTPEEYTAGLEAIYGLPLANPWSIDSRAHKESDPWEGIRALPTVKVLPAEDDDWRYDAFKNRLRSRRGR